MLQLRRNRDKQGLTSVGPAPTRRRYVKMPIVSAVASEKRGNLESSSRHSITLKIKKKVNSLEDFCIFAPPDSGANSIIANTEVRPNRLLQFSEKFWVRLMIDGSSSGNRSIVVPPGMSTITFLPNTCLIDRQQPLYGTRLIPAGTFTGAHFVQTPDYVQVTGASPFTSICCSHTDSYSN